MAYPNDKHYDPNRPSWVPYWIDTPTEVRKLEILTGDYSWFPGGIPDITITNNQQVVKVPNSFNPPTPAAPQTYGQMTDPNKWTLNDLDAGTTDKFIKWNAFSDANSADPDKLNSEMSMWMIVGLAGVGLLMMKK